MNKLVKKNQLKESEKSWAMLCHLSTLLGLFFPFGNILAPLIIWLIQKEDSDYIKKHGIESLNFQLSMLLYMIISTILCCLIIGIFFIIFLFILNLVMIIIASVKAYNGKNVNYPLNIRFIR